MQRFRPGTSHGHGSSRCLIAGLFLLFALGRLHAQAVFQSNSSGQWSSSATWQMVSGADSDGIPDTNDIVTILAGHVVTISTSTQGCASLAVSAGASLQLTGFGNLQITAPGSATINGTLLLSNAGSLIKFASGTDTLFTGTTGKITISGTAAAPSFDVYRLDPASSFEYTSASAQTVRSDISYGNLTLGGSGTKKAAPIPKDTAFYCNGTLTVGAGVIFDVSTDILGIYFNGDVVNSGTIDASVGTTFLTMNGSNWTNNGSYLPSTDSIGFGYLANTTFNNTTIGGNPVSQSFQYLVIQGTVTAQNNLVAKRNITIVNGATLNAGSGLTHSLMQNWVNNGTFNAGTSTVTLNGPVPQAIGPSTFYNVIVNNPKGVSLAGNVTIASGGTLTLTSGNLSTGSYALTVASTFPGAVVTGSNTITGTVTRFLSSGMGTYLFFGQNAYIIPNGIGNPASITSTVFPGTNPPYLHSPTDTLTIAKRYYSISSPPPGPGFSYTLRFPYLQSEVRGNKATYAFWYYDGSGWTNMGGAIVDTQANFVEQAALTGFSQLCIAENNSPLPIVLGAFEAVPDVSSSDVQLIWMTVSEVSNFGFYVERSDASMLNFKEVPGSFVPGNGTSISQHHYSWTDRNVPAGTYYYRLRQADLDGTLHYSGAAKAEVQGGSPFAGSQRFALDQNFPNPFNPETEIRFNVDQTGSASLVIYNSIGQTVSTLFDGVAVAGQSYAVRFNGAGIASGVYFARLTSGGKSDMRKMVLMR